MVFVDNVIFLLVCMCVNFFFDLKFFYILELCFFLNIFCNVYVFCLYFLLFSLFERKNMNF